MVVDSAEADQPALPTHAVNAKRQQRPRKWLAIKKPREYVRPCTSMKIAEFLSPQAVIADLTSRSKTDVLQELCMSLARADPALHANRLVEVLQERERLGSTGIGEGVAIPHGKLNGLPQLIASFGVSRNGVDFQAIDGKPTFLFFALGAPENSAGIHLKALARISRLFKSSRFRDSILHARTPEEIYSLIAQEDARA